MIKTVCWFVSDAVNYVWTLFETYAAFLSL